MIIKTITGILISDKSHLKFFNTGIVCRFILKQAAILDPSHHGVPLCTKDYKNNNLYVTGSATIQHYNVFHLTITINSNKCMI